MLKPLENIYSCIIQCSCFRPDGCAGILRTTGSDLEGRMGFWQVNVGKWGSLCHSIEEEMASRGLLGVPGIHGILGGLVLRHQVRTKIHVFIDMESLKGCLCVCIHIHVYVYIWIHTYMYIKFQCFTFKSAKNCFRMEYPMSGSLCGGLQKVIMLLLEDILFSLQSS